jgi:hypothetical protein
MAEATLSNIPWLGDETKLSIFGLDCRHFTVRDFPFKTYFKMCSAKASDRQPEVYLATRWIDKEPENPFWRLDAWSEADGFSLNIFFPEQALGRWRDVVDAALALVRSWRASP